MNLKLDSPFTFLLFGASGDLAKLKIFPALYTIAEQHRFPADFDIIGFARTKKTTPEFQVDFRESIELEQKENLDQKALGQLTEHVNYFAGDYDSTEDFKELFKSIKTDRPLIAYFSVPPGVFENIIKNLAETKPDNLEIRLVFEKPFGLDLKSAEYLFYFTLNHFPAESLYLLDHYLGKSAVRSLVNLRRNNRVLNLILQGREIDNIQISALEAYGIKNRFGYFDQVGTIKDFVQSHLLQLVALTTMILPLSKTAESFQREKNSILSALAFEPKKENLVLGQYEGYRTADPSLVTSNTETFVALKIGIDQESWHSVPIYIRSGKKLKSKQTYIAVEFKKLAFEDTCNDPNRMIIELYPNEQVSLTLFNAKGKAAENDSLALTDSLACEGDDCLPPHGLFLMDVFRNERTFFLSFQEVIACWKLIDSITEFAAEEKIMPTLYAEDTDGPAAQADLVEQDGRKWFTLK